jgi:DNA primase
MAIFTQESLETLRQRIDLVDVLSSHIDLKKTGASYKALCPFHDEKSPSFTVQKGDTHYHCFGCGAHGDAIQFLMNHLRMSFLAAVEHLGQRFQVHLDKVEGEEKSGPNKAALKEALSHASRLYHFLLLHTPEGHEALEYLYARGITLDFIHHFQIGLAPKQSGLVRRILHSKFVKDETMLDAGLLIGPKGGSYREFFHERITFPIRDATGAIIGFSARKYKETTFGGKYVNTSETPLFKKSRILFGLNYSRRRIVKERKALIVEGQIDALRLIEQGFNFTVAGQGTAFGDGHAKELIALGVNEVFLALDSDNAGLEAACKIGHLFQKSGVEVRVVKLPHKEDPDSFLRKNGAPAFLKLVEESIDYLTFLVRYRERSINIDSPSGKNELIQTISQQIREWENPVVVHESLRKLAHLVQVPESLIGVGAEPVPNLFIKKSANIGRMSIDPDRVMEGDLFIWLILHNEARAELIKLVQLNLTPDDFHLSISRTLYRAIIEMNEQNQTMDLLSLALRLGSEEGQLFLEEILQKKINLEKAEAQIVEAIQRILDRNWMEKSEDVKIKIQSGQCTDDEASELAKVFTELRRNQPKVKRE